MFEQKGRDHIYEALKADGAEKVKRVEQDGPTRNISRSKLVAEDVGPGSTPNDEPNNGHLEDTYNFHEEVDQARNDDIEVDWNGADLNDPDDDHLMVSMVDI